jgi:hypothetical protein
MSLENCRWLRGVVISFAVLLLLCSAQGTYGQAAFATITGRALDPKGAAVLNADVTATNTETGIARTTKTTSDGLYRFDNLAPGFYNVSIESGGFTKAEAKNVKLQVGEQRDINFTLELAGQKQSVVVTSELPLIETTKTDTSTVIDDKAVAELPTTTSFNAIGGVANDYQGLAASAPGVRYDYSGNSSDLVGPGNVNDRGINVNVDGGNISDQSVSSRDALGASLEEVKEFQVLTNNYNAEYGQAGNVILNVITKSGTNSVHGDAHAYFRGRNMGASDYFYNQGLVGNPGGCPASDFTGGALTSIQGCGRAPFFKHEEGFTVGGPFIKDRLFWFGSYEKVAQGAPATLTPFTSPVTVNQPTNEILGSAKLDYKISDKHTLTIRYNLQRDTSANLLVQTGPNTDPSGLVNSVVHDNTLNIGMISSLTPHVINEARFFWHRFLSQTPDASSLPGEALPSAYVGADFCCPQSALQQRFQYIDNVSWTRGAHTFKFGANISHFPYDSGFQQYHFGEFSNFAPGSCTNSFFPAANGECPTQFTIGFGTGYVQASDNIYGLYAQDTWQLKPNLTVNYGLRYDVEIGAFTGGTIRDAAVSGGCLQANGLIPACGSDHNNWQPRVGIAWSPNYSSGLMHKLFGDAGKSVVRVAGAEVTEMAYLNVVLDSLNFDGNTLFTQGITAGSIGTDGKTTGQAVLNAYPNEPSTNLLALFKPIGFFGRIRPISPTIKNPEVHMGSMSFQRQVGSSFVYSIGYQGVFAHGLFGETDTNFPTPVADPNHPGYFYFPQIPVAAGQTENDRPNPAFSAIRTNFSNRDSGYNALVVTAEKRLAHHFQFTSSYTWSHTLSNGEDFFGLSEPANPLASLSQETASAQQDIRHLVNFNFIMDSNNLVHTGILNHVVNNWTFGLLSTLQSGRPYPVSTGDGAFAGDNFPALGSETNQRPNICTSGSSIPGCAGAPVGTLVTTNIASISGTNYAVSAAGIAACNAAGVVGCPTTATTFVAPANASSFGAVDSMGCTNQFNVVGPCGTAFPNSIPVDFQYISGNLLRNAGQSDALYRFDISLSKAFPIPKWESAKLELKLEVFNVFNHPLFILNNGNDVLSFLSLPKLLVPNPSNPSGPLIPNPQYNTCTLCINPQTGLYLGANGTPININNFQRVTQDAAKNYAGLGGAAGDVTPRIMQLAIRFRW